ncbi:uncharacterized protein VP01_543g1 [Puccinia sorghi]|uniref:SEC7 domain-containing protein n=1 Tax=Puccinia sorghi TaxID=27349 RepID=A0A0L6ULP2_9BASI|nr:uncharacterized protein VP01_543g1 [Puccinia sorghi]
MRKRSAFFRRKPSASQSQAADPTCEEASPPPQLSCSPPPSEPRTLRQPFNSEPSHRHHHHNHYQKRTPVDAPPVPIVPLSYHQNSSAQSINPPPSSMPPSPLKTRLPSPSSSSTRPGHSLDPQDPTLGVSTSTHPRCHGSPAESLLSPIPSSRSHSPALSPPKHFPMSSPSPTSSQPPKSSWLLSTSPRAFSERPDHPLILRGAQTRSPSSINLSLSSLSNGRSTLPSLESRPSKTRPMLSAATFSGSRPSTPLEADDSQLASQPPLSSSLALKSPSPTHRTAHFPTPGLSEEDQLRLSLQLWNLDQDGILRPPSADSPTTPKACQSSSAASPSKTTEYSQQLVHTTGFDLQSALDIDTLSSSGSISSFFSASSDPNDLSVHAQDAAIPERVLYTHILRSPPAVKKYNLTKNPTENSTFSASHCLPSLVNPNRTTMQPRYPAELFDRPLNTLTRIKALDSPDGTILLPSSSQLFTSPPHLSSKHSSSSDHSTAKLTCGSTSPPNSSTVGSSSPQPTVVSRANSMKECRDPSSAEQVTATLVDKFRRRGYTHNDSASASKLLESHPPAPSRVPNIPPSISAQLDDTSCATHSESASCMVDPLPGTETEDSGTDDLPSHLPPSIRFVSSTSRTNSGEQDSPKSLVTAVSPLKSSTGSARSSPLNRGDLSQSSRSSGNTSATVRAHHHSQVSKPSHAFRCNPGLGIKPTVESDRPLAPQLHRRDLDHAPPPKHGAIMEDHRTPRNHQSSPNLRNPRPSTPPDTSFFSVIVSGPQLPQDGSVVAERQSLVAHSSHLHPLSSPSSSSNPEGPSDPADRRSSLVIPGMTPEANARRLAELFWLGDESLIKRRKLTEWLGSPDTPENQLQALTRRAFMNNFDFKDLRIDLAFRKLCTKMYLKGETQQVDRILAEFSRRYWEQNQSHIYVNTDMVHALSYSILLLNTDLHVVDTTSRMSRSQFIRNTLETVYAQLSQSASALTADRSMNSFPGSSRPSLTTDPLMPNFKHPSSGSMVTRNRRTSFSSTRSSMERWRGALINGSQPVIKTSRRSHSITSWPSDSDLRARASVGSPASVTSVTDRVDRHHSVDARRSRSSVVGRPDGHWNTAPSNPTDNDIYMAIKTHPIAQNPAESHSQEPAPYGSLQRIGSRRSHLTQGVGDSAGSHKRASLRGFGGFAAMLSASAEPTAVRPTSPTPSATTSVSSSSVNLTNLTTPSIGFVSNLSQSIIREQHEEESLESSQAEDEIARDSELALLGAPWAKEGILQRKQYWESKGKRHRDRSWAEVFVVIQSGVLKMFQFGQGTTGSSAASGAGVVTSSGNEDDNSTNNNNASSNSASAVGGGNWLPNAQLLGAITLSHALTSVLVSGYSKERAHVFVLTLSNGASYFFQAGTEELVYEWVSTCNYWAARLSKEPLTGGVSNMEYGWNQLQEMDLANAADKKEELRECQTDRDEMMSIVSGQSGHSHKGRRLRDRLFNGLPLGTPHSPSVVTHQPGHRTSDLERWSQSATSVDSQTPPASQLITDPKGTTTTTTTTSPALLPLDRHLPPSHPPSLPDKFTISDWNPPVPPMALSSLPEHVQLATLKRHNAHMQVELEKHNLLRRPMVNMYWNRPIHLQKAMVNWEKKSQYLMAEIIKYTTYLNALEATIHLKLSLPNRAASTRLNPPSSSSD